MKNNDSKFNQTCPSDCSVLCLCSQFFNKCVEIRKVLSCKATFLSFAIPSRNSLFNKSLLAPQSFSKFGIHFLFPCLFTLTGSIEPRENLIDSRCKFKKIF